MMQLEAEPAVEAGSALEADEEQESVAASGADPQMLATLARLERFLDAIQSLRA